METPEGIKPTTQLPAPRTQRVARYGPMMLRAPSYTMSARRLTTPNATMKCQGRINVEVAVRSGIGALMREC
jgi:hypothetical protein